MFYADRNSLGLPNEGQEYPDLIPTNHFLNIPDGKYKPVYANLKKAMTAFFGANTMFRLTWDKDNIAKYFTFEKAYTPSDINWFWEFIKTKYGDAFKSAPEGEDFFNWVKELHEKQVRERRVTVPQERKNPGYTLILISRI